MEQKLREIFDLDRIRDFVKAHIGQTGYVEEDCGERRKVLVVDTLIDGAHGVYIPGMVLDLFGRVDRYDMADLYDPEASEVLYDTLACLEDEINDCLNRLLPSRGRYYVGYHEVDGSYCLFYEEETRMRKIKVIVIEAGPDYTEEVDRWEMELPDDEAQAVAEAIEAVEAMGYTVLPNDRGGCNEYCTVFDGNDYIAVTVAPCGEEEEK